MTAPGLPRVPESVGAGHADLTDILRWIAQAARRLNGLLDGKSDNYGTVTLTANATTTTLKDARLNVNSVILLMPKTLNAAVAIDTLYFSTPTKGQVVINHGNDANADKTFRYIVVG